MIREHTRAPILLVASNGSAGLLEQALESDVSDVLLLPQLVENVVFAIRKATHSTRRHHDSGGGSGRHGKIVTVFSPKGGTGKTVTATNLGSSLAKHWGKRALLLDLDLQFGDAAIMLGIEPEKTIQDLVTAPGELDPEKLAVASLLVAMSPPLAWPLIAVRLAVESALPGATASPISSARTRARSSPAAWA